MVPLMDKRKSEYVAVKIPKELYDEIEVIVNAGLGGYRSKMEFVTDAVRRRIEEVKKRYGISS